MSKKPSISPPIVGNRVKLRGRPNTGKLTSINHSTRWASVDWDIEGPKICHLDELEGATEAFSAMAATILPEIAKSASAVL